MNLVDRLTADMKTAMKSKDKLALSVIRMMRSEMKYAEISKGNPLTDDEIIDVLSRECKKRRDSIEEYVKADREDVATQLQQEVEIISAYLPEQLSKEEVESIIDKAIKETNVSSIKEMGKLMQAVMPQVKGKADGKLVNQLVKEKLS
ncbi:GatB/YqeY domain-containing protein [Alkalicella caledoniensis]|uniref:GatB/YqeY domain-containing protein n=1 Tax=Alkalicella caledoniensis TaxID=2731377 RepID=A0A7G9W4E9_ALKCA|nr:GatB/YqeY domain-containing protein [Alkalicella caledoniensis]QNO13561.1 GatB/YqeY domain-containing protein [Alkalicella caledoniensis]